MNLKVHITEPERPRLIRDYRRAEPALAGYYNSEWPLDAAAYANTAGLVAQRFANASYRALAPAIRATTPEAAERLHNPGVDGLLMVTTGQQPGLFGGPLYTIYKTLSAIRLAAILEQELERPVLPLFWIASDDHDWEEVRYTNLLSTSNQLVRVELPQRPNSLPAPVGKHVLDHNIHDAVALLSEHLPETEFRTDILAALQSAYAPGRTLAQAFADLMAWLFSQHHLLLLDAAHPAVKKAGAPVIHRELRLAQENERTLKDRVQELKRAGYHAQVPVIPGAANVFFEGSAGRERLRFGDHDSWSLRNSDQGLERETLEELIRDEPARFSPNVLLRPVVESALLPSIAYVGGPAEISYLAEASCLFAAHKIPMPLVLPRLSSTLIEAKIDKVFHRHGLSPHSVCGPEHDVTTRLVRESLPECADSALVELRSSVQDGWERLLDAAKTIDPTLAGPVNKAQRDNQRLVDDIQKRVVRQLKRRNQIMLDQIRKARANLFPDDSPQERVINVLQYLVRYGPDLLPAISDAADQHFSDFRRRHTASSEG